MSQKNYYYLDSSVLLEEGFHHTVEQLLSSDAEISFVLDTHIYHEIELYRELGKREEALTLESYAALLSDLDGTVKVDTAGGFDADALAALAKEKLFVLTQQPKPVDNYRTLGDAVSFLSFDGQGLVPFSGSTAVNGEAFCPDRDIYVNPLDGEKLSYVYSPRYGYLKLDKSKAYSGGEGVCYRTYNGLLCKLYYKKHMTYVNYKKLQTMVNMRCSSPYISWPLDILYYRNQFVGYVMRELTDVRSLDELRDDNFSGFRLLDRFIIARNFLSVIEYLHSRNILVGDMKLDNILVKPNCDVYIIDAGSFQVRDYACNVCHKEYTERVYTGDDLRHILRSVREEYFPINKIIFEILMMKGPFYSRDNTEIDGDGSRDFNFPVELPTTGGADLPYHMKVWFALSVDMRRFFHRYFAEGKVTYLSEWIRELDHYILSKQKAAGKM